VVNLISHIPIMTNLQLLLIDISPIVRLGLRAVFVDYSDLQVVAEIESGSDAGNVLNAIANIGDGNHPNLVIWDLDVQKFGLGDRGGFPERQSMGDRGECLWLCQQLKKQYPNLPILLFTELQLPAFLVMAKQSGVNGYCSKNLAVAELVAVIRQVASGENYWPGEVQEQSRGGEREIFGNRSLHRRLINHISGSGMQQIDFEIAELNQQLENHRRLGTEDLASLVDGLFLTGRRRELWAARWILSQLLITGEEPNNQVDREQINFDQSSDFSLPVTKVAPGVSNLQLSVKSLATNNLPAVLFDTAAAKLQSNLVNLTGETLEIDIFQLTRKRELISVILQKLQNVLDELRSAQLPLRELSEKRSAIIRDLWETVVADFFGKYYALRIEQANVSGDIGAFSQQRLAAIEGNETFIVPPSSMLFSEGKERIEVVPILLQEGKLVESSILDKIPLVVELLAHLVFQTPLIIDNASYLSGSPEAMLRAQAILENLVIQLANGVVQPLLNNFADLEEIKQKFYNRELISTREIERFRNDLSWKYRIEKLVGEPQAIFESRFLLLVLTERGIQKISIYAPRNMELAQLSGVQLVVTLLLEMRDAIAPRIRSIVAFLGTGIVYVLTQVIGRGIGLVGRGIIQGIGNSLQDGKYSNTNK
jgi:DNA-binding NarL/FixJ family response regulator